MCAPGVHDGNNPPSGSASVKATTSGERSSRSVTTAVLVRRTGATPDGFHRDADAKPPNRTPTPHNAVYMRSRLRRPYRSAGLVLHIDCDTVSFLFLHGPARRGRTLDDLVDPLGGEPGADAGMRGHHPVPALDRHHPAARRYRAGEPLQGGRHEVILGRHKHLNRN